jgi:hypothetical protein
MRRLRDRVASMRLSLALPLLLLAGCATLAGLSLDDRFGAPDPARYDTPRRPDGGVSYRADVQPILEKRCVVCHGCYDAPCQLKLGAWDGIARGASTAPVYDAGRLVAAPTTRLDIDAQLPSQWRAKGFFPVLNERTPTPDANVEASLLHRTLALKRAHPLPASGLVPAALDVSSGRSDSCPTVETFDDFARANPLAGMPLGLPALDAAELDTVTRWLRAGAPYEGPLPPSAIAAARIAQWEAFLNGDALEERLMSRYLYEHLFLAQLYFDDDPQRRAYRMVRSTTPPGRLVATIATRRPYDDPGVARAYYRLVPESETILAKTHMPYTLGPSRMAKYRAWFLAPAVRVDALPGYAPATASNPFVTFAALPADARYRFLLDEAQYFIATFIKGPVCRGQVAVDVIEDRFWVWFVEPSRPAATAMAAWFAREPAVALPAARGSSSLDLLAWNAFAAGERKYLDARSEYLARTGPNDMRDDLGRIWDGAGTNPNAALTVFRHYDSATVLQGLVGAPTKTAWVIDYPLFERLYYLLVAGYDVFGNAVHQLDTRLYMDFMRMEGEFNFLVMLPRAARRPTAEYWYRGAPGVVQEYVYGTNARFDRESAIVYRTADPQRELYERLRERVAPVLSKRHDLAPAADGTLLRELQALDGVRGAALAFMPEAALLRVDAPGRAPRYFSVLRNTAHANVTHLFREKAELLPGEDTLTVAAGFVGAYPNALYAVAEPDLPAFVAAVRALRSESDYAKLAARFAVRRTDPAFWRASDTLLEAYRAWAPAEAGLLDYSRLENR